MLYLLKSLPEHLQGDLAVGTAAYKNSAAELVPPLSSLFRVITILGLSEAEKMPALYFRVKLGHKSQSPGRINGTLQLNSHQGKYA